MKKKTKQMQLMTKQFHTICAQNPLTISWQGHVKGCVTDFVRQRLLPPNTSFSTAIQNITKIHQIPKYLPINCKITDSETSAEVFL